MKKPLIYWSLLFLLFLPSIGRAAAAPALPASFQCAAAKQIAAGYVVLLKQKYAANSQDPEYLAARLKYQTAAAKFAGLRSTIELEMIGGLQVPNINAAKYQPLTADALAAFADFRTDADKLLFDKTVPGGDKALTLPGLVTILTDVVSFVGKFQDLWVKQEEIRETRLKKLTDWINAYYTWPDWDELNKTVAGT